MTNEDNAPVRRPLIVYDCSGAEPRFVTRIRSLDQLNEALADGRVFGTRFSVIHEDTGLTVAGCGVLGYKRTGKTERTRALRAMSKSKRRAWTKSRRKRERQYRAERREHSRALRKTKSKPVTAPQKAASA